MAILVKPRPLRRIAPVSMESPLIDEQVGEQHSVDIFTRNIHLRTVLEILIGMTESGTFSEVDDHLAEEAFAIAHGAREGNPDPFVEYEAERNYIGFKKAHNRAGGDITALAAHLALLETAHEKFNEQYEMYHQSTHPTE